MSEPAHVSPDELADLVEAVLSVARRVTVLGNRDPDAVVLNPLEALLMRQIDQTPGATPSQLAAHLDLKSSNTSTALRDLESRGFIRRRVDPTDGRSVRIYPTPAAQENRTLKRASWARVVAPVIHDRRALATGVALLSQLDRDLDSTGQEQR